MANGDCVFCNIYNEKEPAEIIYKDENVVVFPDIKPAAKHHYLVVPKSHLVNAKQLTKEHIPLVESLVEHGKRVLQEKQANLEDSNLSMFCKDWQNFDQLDLQYTKTNQVNLPKNLYRFSTRFEKTATDRPPRAFNL